MMSISDTTRSLIITAYVSLDLVETQWKCFMNATNYCEPWNRLYKSILLTALESSFVTQLTFEQSPETFSFRAIRPNQFT